MDLVKMIENVMRLESQKTTTKKQKDSWQKWPRFFLLVSCFYFLCKVWKTLKHCPRKLQQWTFCRVQKHITLIPLNTCHSHSSKYIYIPVILSVTLYHLSFEQLDQNNWIQWLYWEREKKFKFHFDLYQLIEFMSSLWLWKWVLVITITMNTYMFEALRQMCIFTSQAT